jgi:uncharacterized protein (DUF697 family)
MDQNPLQGRIVTPELHDRIQTARASAYVLLLVSAVALGAALAAIHNHRWTWAAGMTAVTLLLAWGSAAERQEMWDSMQEAQ